MSKSEGAKFNYGLRREMRLRRDKTAALLLAPLMPAIDAAGGDDEAFELALATCIFRAVRAADELLAELDNTRPDLSPPKEQS